MSSSTPLALVVIACAIAAALGVAIGVWTTHRKGKK